ncbi:MAG: PepSY domain-containing protein [Alphaproteobacteria bacterium]|nr:PepSY domain-containing protein [Alphaproteobacteria bacterium]
MRLLPWLAVVCSMLLGLAGGGPGRADERADHDRARRALERNEIRPLSAILDAVRPRLPGEVVRVELEQSKGRWLYEFRVIDGAGRVYEVQVDATSAAIERIKEK